MDINFLADIKGPPHEYKQNDDVNSNNFQSLNKYSQDLKIESFDGHQNVRNMNLIKNANYVTLIDDHLISTTPGFDETYIDSKGTTNSEDYNNSVIFFCNISSETITNLLSF